LITVVPPDGIAGSFDLLLAVAVLQRERHKIAEMQTEDLSPYYPFERFDEAVRELVARLRTGGLLCVDDAHYRVEDSSAAAELDPIRSSPVMRGLMFGRDGPAPRCKRAHDFPETLARRLAGKTVGEVTDAQAPDLPAGRDGGEGAEDEAAAGELGMGDGEAA